MSVPRAEVVDFYRRYLDQCNRHRFSDLGDFVADEVEVNGRTQTRREYGAGLASVIEQFPDFHWTLEQLVVEDHSFSALLLDTGTTAHGDAFQLHELALYRLDDAVKIASVWGDLDPARLPAQDPRR